MYKEVSMILSTDFALLLGHMSHWHFFLLFCIFSFTLSISLMVGAHSVLEHDFPVVFMWKRKAGASRALEILRKDSKTNGRNSEPWADMCSAWGISSLGTSHNLENSKGLSRTQCLLKFQAYSRNWKKVSSQSWMCLQLMWDWIPLSDASFKLNLVSLSGSSVEKVLKNKGFLPKS